MPNRFAARTQLCPVVAIRRCAVAMLCLGLTAALAGCASWAAWDSTENVIKRASKPTLQDQLPPGKVSRRLELDTRYVQVNFDPNQADQIQSLWQWTDETVVPSALRKDLQRNGLRIGKVIQEQRLLSRLQTMKDETQGNVLDEFLAAATLSGPQAEGAKLVPLSLGRRMEFSIRQPLAGEHAVIVYQEPQPIGKTLLDPQFILAITALASDEMGEARLKIRPEVQLGSMRPDVIRGQAGSRIDMRRDAWSLAELEFEIAGAEGDWFMISGTVPQKGVGKQMFSGKSVQQQDQLTVMLLRFANVPKPSDQL